MPVFVRFIFIAAFLYTVSIWTEQIKKELKTWMVIVFSIALVCDLTGTTMMAFRASSHSLCIHTICGYGALVIMFFHLIFAIKAFKNEKYEILFTRHSWKAWIVWMIAFFSGMFLR
jgi:uncharacterized repeat protein (TIGR03987 family)